MDDEREQITEEEPTGFAHEPTGGESVHIEVGRGNTAEVQVGAPFVETIERLAEEAHYGGYFRVFKNGEELTEDPWLDAEHTQLNPNYPTVIEQGMRIALTSYDKVGA